MLAATMLEASMQVATIIVAKVLVTGKYPSRCISLQRSIKRKIGYEEFRDFKMK